MDIVLITTGSRPDLLKQTNDSLINNSDNWHDHKLTIVWDQPSYSLRFSSDTVILVGNAPQGASAARNIGAASTPEYRRQEHLMFIDDDVYMMPGWDTLLTNSLVDLYPSKSGVISGHAHPFNKPVGSLNNLSYRIESTYVLSTVHMITPWSVWDRVGPFIEPGGPGGSEDVEWCKRAVEMRIELGVTDPMCVVHCGLTSSTGNQIVGYDLMMEMNLKLVRSYGLEGEVEYG